MIDRIYYKKAINTAIEDYPVVALIGARQVGKTTIARSFLKADSTHYFDLEDPTVETIMENPMSALQHLEGLVIIDEAQRQPKLFPVLRVLADREENTTTFLILGSASPSLIKQSSETLAGRIHIIEMTGFTLDEIPTNDINNLWLRGGFPRSFLSNSEKQSNTWRKNFIRTYLERDLASLGFNMAPASIRRFWIMLSHLNSQLWNASSMANSLQIAPNTAKSYLDALEQTFMIRQLLPWHSNTKKRLVKSPKVYFTDTGILHTLLGIDSASTLMTHPQIGNSWEAFVLQQITRSFKDEDAFFYATHAGMELDLYYPNRNLGIEIKRQDSPKITKSMRSAFQDLELDQLWVVYPGNREYVLDENITVKPIHSFI